MDDKNISMSQALTFLKFGSFSAMFTMAAFLSLSYIYNVYSYELALFNNFSSLNAYIKMSFSDLETSFIFILRVFFMLLAGIAAYVLSIIAKLTHEKATQALKNEQT